MSFSYLINEANAAKVEHRKSTVLALYPELSRLYSNTRKCAKCKKNSKGRAILIHILNDPDLKSKDKKALAQILPKDFVAKLGE